MVIAPGEAKAPDHTSPFKTTMGTSGCMDWSETIITFVATLG